MLLFTLLAVCCASGCARGAVPVTTAPARDKPHYPEAAHAQFFEEFKATYNKQYATPDEELHRFGIFKNNFNEINRLNAKYKETVYGITKFSDLTTEEFISQNTGLLVDKSIKPRPPPLTNLSVVAPDAFDWRDKKVVTRVKDQGLCGSCWAFATIGSLESNYAIKHNKLIEFSEQQLVDCDLFDVACMGGDPMTACRYIKYFGEEGESDYPYNGKLVNNTTCLYDGNKVKVYTSTCNNYANISEEHLKNLLYSKGPIIIGIDCNPFIGYTGGIITKCSGRQLNHAVLLVGYRTEKGLPFWIIKNSWGENSGEKGYYRVQRGVNCLGLVNRLVAHVGE